jgi:hypothetical protein
VQYFTSSTVSGERRLQMTASVRTTVSQGFVRNASAASVAARIATRAAVASVPDRRRAPVNTAAARRLRERLGEIYPGR